MSDGLGKAVGSGVPIVFNGEHLILEPMTLRDYGLIEQHIIQKRVNPVEKVRPMLDGLSDEAQKHLLSLAYADLKGSTTATLEESTAFIDSIEGVAFTLWILLNKSMPGKYTLPAVQEIVNAMTPEELSKVMNARDQAAGTDELGNSTGQRRAKRKSTRSR